MHLFSLFIVIHVFQRERKTHTHIQSL